MRKYLPLFLPVVLLFSILASAGAAQTPSGKVYPGSKSQLDATYQNDGYITIKLTSAQAKRYKVSIEKDSGKYTYDLNSAGNPENFPLQMGDGDYRVKVLENISGTKYSVVQTVTLNVKYNSANAPFLVPCQQVNFATAPATVEKAAALTASAATEIAKVEACYKYVLENIKYDNDKARQISQGQITNYVPNVDGILASGKGICYDYSALLAAMLRSLGIPTKLVMGYVAPNNIYHAWNEVYITGIGWIRINSNIYFDGKTFARIDATFASANSSGAKTEFIGNGLNYSVKFVY